MREEQRWKAERDTLLHEIHTLQLRIQELQHQTSLHQSSVSDSVSNIAKLLQVLKDGDLGININRITDSGSSAIPLVDTEIKEKEVIVKEVTSVSETPEKEENKRITPQKGIQSKGSKRKTLRKGSEGEDVREMQEALQKLGFYSGEDDMEYSAYDTGTERAVKTWQASIGISEDGIMTSKLLERLYMDEIGGSSLPGDETSESDIVASLYQTANGVPVSSITNVQQTIVKGEHRGGEVPERRVFLLGENRWEDSSRLSANKKEPSSASGKNSSSTKCLTCRGEGRLLCMECDGTGEPNIEEQFMEWVDEGAKCPYCEGHGYSVCDVCQGKKVVEA